MPAPADTSHPAWITPDWPAPAHVRAFSTLRCGGCSQAPWESLNLGSHVGDDPDAVACNRQMLVDALDAPAMPLWLSQVHGCAVADPATDAADCKADAAVTERSGHVCVVMTADCLPVLLTDQQGSMVGVAHAGWRGLCDGVLEATVARFRAQPGELMAWLGPAISQRAFEVGEEVRQAFLDIDPAAEAAFVRNVSGRWMADLYLLARQRLNRAGVTQVSGGDRCTFSEEAAFFSYRRDGVTGRMATLVWLEEAR